MPKRTDGIITLYKLTNPYDYGRCYVGCTKQYLENRLQDHRGEARGTRSNAPIHKAIREWGWECFTVEVLATVRNDEDYARNVLEPFFIKKHEAFTRGYNDTIGGPGIMGRKRPAEEIKKCVLWKLAHPECLKKGALARKGMIAFTNGESLIWLKKGQPAPKGYVPGVPGSKVTQQRLKKAA